MTQPLPNLPWLAPEDPFPPIFEAWGDHTPAPGLLAAGGALSTTNLLNAYSHGIFPWFSEDQPILWWSTNPRMTLHTPEFRLHRSLRKVIRKFIATPGAEICINHDFHAVIDACSSSVRRGQTGTWISPQIRVAYENLHREGYAHSVETWQDGELTGGLYCVAIGRAVFGESMFANRTDASKIALAALVGMTRSQGVNWIDCQQVTDHLAFMGARPIDRTVFAQSVSVSLREQPIDWTFQPVYWDELLSACATPP
ncbi:MAG: leucyl/phenylalanyl-tRNA--protein transferase [Rhodoferax sp.]|nr:leucyl/phenylalanyl-tRNA--protein transferase [Rhodoferax sp.]